MNKQKKANQKRVKRNKKRQEIKVENKARRMTKAQQQQAVDSANRAKEIRRYETAGLAIMFKILNGRDPQKTDRFKPEDIGKLCKDFLKKYKKMNKADKKEFNPLVNLAERKIESVKRYKDLNKKLLKEKKEIEKIKEEKNEKK